jgi:putative ABC transport system ATP-binding protein
VFQEFNLFPTLTVRENVELVLNLKRIRNREARRRACEMLERVGMAEKSNSYPAGLSGGQKQRVAIARALVNNPGIILADEPTASLDSATGRSVMELLRDFANKSGRAVVVVTHDGRMADFADRIIHIEDGKIETSHEPQTCVLSARL